MPKPKPSIAIAIFAKTPSLSPVKTRLAADIGDQSATAFYQHSLACTKDCALDVQQQISHIHLYWALAEKTAPEMKEWQNHRPAIDPLWTGEGDLGHRLHSVYNHLLQQHDGVILIGSDCPHLEPQVLMQAVHALHHTPERYILGPCEDGGFYLFAGAHKLHQDCWTSVTYSQHDTLEQLSRSLNKPSQLLDINFDIDTVLELRKLKKMFVGDLDSIHQSRAQKQLKNWLINSSL